MWLVDISLDRRLSQGWRSCISAALPLFTLSSKQVNGKKALGQNLDHYGEAVKGPGWGRGVQEGGNGFRKWLHWQPEAHLPEYQLLTRLQPSLKHRNEADLLPICIKPAGLLWCIQERRANRKEKSESIKFRKHHLSSTVKPLNVSVLLELQSGADIGQLRLWASLEDQWNGFQCFLSSGTKTSIHSQWKQLL